MKGIPSLLLALAAGCTGPVPPQPPPGEAARPIPADTAIAGGVAFLVRSQNQDGSWGTGRDTTDFDVMAAVPGSHDAFRVAVTALCVMALREAGEKAASGRGLGYLVSYDGARRATPWEIYNVWAHALALQALARAGREDDRKDCRKAAERHLGHLQRYETFVGGWNYYDFNYGTRIPSMEPTSFGTAAGLAALHEAGRSGIAVPESLVRRALDRLREMRKPDGSFLYGGDFRYVPMHLANRLRGSVGRTQPCHYALWIWDKGVGEKEALEGLEMFFREHKFLDIARKRQYPHESWYFNSPYYYYFDHYYAALLVERLADKGDFPGRLAACVLPWQEADGSWWDYKMYDYHKPYGTAFAVMTLLRCR
jgi:hypothetical protein